MERSSSLIPRGLVSIFDDEIEDDSTNIYRLRNALINEGFACAGFSEPPSEGNTVSLHSCSFHILDWQIAPHSTSTSALAVASIEQLLNVRPAPIFVLTNQDADEVSAELKEAGYDPNAHPLIWVKRKTELQNDSGGLDHIQETLERWLNESASAKALVLWQRNLADASNQITLELVLRSANWPALLHKALETDGVSGGHGVGEILNRLLINAIVPLDFDPGDDRTVEEEDGESMIKVLSAERFIKESLLPAGDIRCGDVFKVSKKVGLAINITPDCDCIPRRGNENPKLLLLKAEYRTLKNVQEKGLGEVGGYGDVIAKSGFCVVPYVNEEKCLVVRLKCPLLEKYDELNDKRIGRLLPPYISHVLNQYVANVGRQAHIPIPESLRPTFGESAQEGAQQAD